MLRGPCPVSHWNSHSITEAMHRCSKSQGRNQSCTVFSEWPSSDWEWTVCMFALVGNRESQAACTGRGTQAGDTPEHIPACPEGCPGCWRLLSTAKCPGHPWFAVRCGQECPHPPTTSLQTLPCTLPRCFQKSPRASVLPCYLHVPSCPNLPVPCHGTPPPTPRPADPGTMVCPACCPAQLLLDVVGHHK